MSFPLARLRVAELGCRRDYSVRDGDRWASRHYSSSQVICRVALHGGSSLKLTTSPLPPA